MASQHWLVTLLGLITVSAANLLPASSTLDEAAAQPALAVQLAGPSEATPRTLAVVDFDSENLETDDLASINQSLAAAFSGRSDLSVQPLTSTRSRLVEAGFLPHDPYKPAPSASSLAKVLQADYVITGEVNKGAGGYTLKAEVYNARSGQTVNRETRTLAGPLSNVLDQMSGLASDLLPRPRPVPPKPREVKPVTPRPVREEAEEEVASSAKEVKKLTSQVKELQEELQSARRDLQQYRDEVKRLKEAQDALPTLEPPAPFPTTVPATAPDVKQSFQPAPPTIPVSPATAPAEPSAQDRAEAARIAREAAANGMPLEERVSLLKRAVELDPRSLPYHQELAKAYLYQREFNQAREALDQALRQFPNHSELLTIKGATYFEEGDLARAERTFREALSANSDDAFAQFNLAQTIQESGAARRDEALREWERYFEIAPKDPRQQKQGWIENAKRLMERLRATPVPATAPQH